MIIAWGVGGICTGIQNSYFCGRNVIVLPIFLETTLQAQICHLLFWMESTCYCTKARSLKLKA